MYLSKILLLSLCFFIFSQQSQSQTIQTGFGKNRVQYHDDFNNWWMYETDHFVTFWYGKGRNIAKPVMQLAEMDHDEIQQLLAHSINDKIRIIIYLDHSDYTQTNISYWDSGEAGGAGLAQFYENKVIVFFDGNHTNLRKQIKAGIARAYLISMFKGISMQEIYQNLVSSDLPNWFVSGLVAYIGDSWDATLEQDLAYFFRQKPKKVKKFSSFAKKYPELAGHSMWNFISENYGNQSISDFLYLVRIHNDLNKAFKYVFEIDAKNMYRNWQEFYTAYFEHERFDPGENNEEKIVKKFKFPVTRLEMDSDAETLFYVENNFGRVKIKSRKLDTGQEKTLLKYGYKNLHQITDFHYPLIKYDSVENRLGVIFENKDQIYYRLFDLKDGSYIEHLFPESIQRIYSFDWYDPGFLILSGATDGFSDLHFYNMEKRLFERITDDIYDESELLVGEYQNERGVFVLSNSDSGTFAPLLYDSFPPISDFDLYFYNPETSQGKKLLTNKDIDESKIIINGDDFTLLSDRRFYTTPEMWELDGEVENMSRNPSLPEKNILDHAFRAGKYLSSRKSKEKEWTITMSDHLHPFSMSVNKENIIAERPFSKSTILKGEKSKKDLEPDIEIDESLLFQTEFPDPERDIFSFDVNSFDSIQSVELKLSGDEKKELPVYKRSRAVASRLRFSFNELVTKVDNQPLFEGLESFNDLSENYNAPPSGLLLKSTVKDLFEDHVIEGGARMSADLRGFEYFLSYDNQKKRTDWKYALYRKTDTKYEHIIPQSVIADKLKIRTNLGLVRAKYPLDIYTSIHASGILRFDNTILTATNLESLNEQSISEQRLILGLDYIFDNTGKKGTNLLHGTRFKVFAKFSNRFNIRFESPSAFNLSKGRMGILGVDARQYFEVLEHSVLALRFAGQTSFGNEKNIYFLGGVENWFFGRNDETFPIPSEEDFAFKVQAANLRGFPYNVRNGSSFALVNIEYRIPLFSYLISSHIKYAFFRDFQLVGFFDSGVAWYGWTPFSEVNTANVYYHEAPPAILLKIKQFKDPLVAGMGFGVRTTIFGYFLKLDYAWGIESGKIRPPMLYFSMGFDF